MGEKLAEQPDRAAIEAMAVAAAGVLGWPGVVLPEVSLFGSRLRPVVDLDVNAHRVREATGDGPQRDGDTLAMWEWPESAGHVPPVALRMTGALFTAGGGWRRALAVASRWRGFGPAAVLSTVPIVVDEVCRLDFQLCGIGLVRGAEHPRPGPASSVERVLPADEGRREPARRRVADRWIEETLYDVALQLGHYSTAPVTRPA